MTVRDQKCSAWSLAGCKQPTPVGVVTFEARLCMLLLHLVSAESDKGAFFALAGDSPFPAARLTT